MRRFAASVVVALVVCLVGLPALAAEGAKGTSHDMTVQFVAFDAKAKTVQFKDDKGEAKTAPVMDSAVASFAEMKAGDRITITCADNAEGEHQGVSMAKKAAPPKHG